MEKKWKSQHTRLSETCACDGCKQARIRYLTNFGVQDRYPGIHLEPTANK